MAPKVAIVNVENVAMFSCRHLKCSSTAMRLVWDKERKLGFIISFFNDYLARRTQHKFTSLSLYPVDMVVKLGQILPKEEKKKQREREKARPVNGQSRGMLKKNIWTAFC